jgi:hypothetical protein
MTISIFRFHLVMVGESLFNYVYIIHHKNKSVNYKSCCLSSSHVFLVANLSHILSSGIGLVHAKIQPNVGKLVTGMGIEPISHGYEPRICAPADSPVVKWRSYQDSNLNKQLRRLWCCPLHHKSKKMVDCEGVEPSSV